ncbi:MAG: aldo/keto reductase [Pirellulales bacterium]
MNKLTPQSASVAHAFSRRRLGNSDLEIAPVMLGGWPISGMTTLDVTESESLATLEACFELGVNSFDTAFGYGMEGESERMIARVCRGRRDQVVIATKVGLGWNSDRTRVIDGRPETLRRQCDECLRRLESDRVEVLYLHAPDPTVPLADSAGALAELQAAGKARLIGASNFSVQQLADFHAVCPIAAFQPPYNMLQRQIECDSLPWCRERGIAVLVYWPLLKGLLAGRLARDHVFQPGDGRAKYPMFQGAEWQKNQDFVDELRRLAAEAGRSVAEIVVNWTIEQPGVTAAICGAKRPGQIRESAAALTWRMPDWMRSRIDAALQTRGEPQVKAAV